MLKRIGAFLIPYKCVYRMLQIAQKYIIFIVKNGETEGEIYIETDTGLIVDRKKRTVSSDYKSIKENGDALWHPHPKRNNILNSVRNKRENSINLIIRLIFC